MIVGIGNDIIEIERIEKAISKEGFKDKIYTQRELENIEKRGNRTETYAGIFSAKEAISKAIGTLALYPPSNCAIPFSLVKLNG